MKPQHTLGRAITPDGKEIILHERDGAFAIRVNGLELMSSRAHGSEEALARLVMALVREARPRILVGGLGMGYTLRAVLDLAPSEAGIVVSEIFPAVIEWNRNELADLAGAPLEDPRVTISATDVGEVIARNRRTFDAILLDVDNGPAAFTTEQNNKLYGERGLQAIYGCLRTRGVLGVWSSDPDRAFERRLSKAGFEVSTETVRARQGAKGPRHTIFMARRG